MSKLPIILVIGLSGVGKTQLGVYTKEDLKFLHIEQDRADGDVIDMIGVRREWDQFLEAKDASALAPRLRDITVSVGRKGIIMTFTSMVRLSLEQIEAAKQAGITTILLYGSGEDCLDSYLEREKGSGRGFDEARWLKYNRDSMELFNKPEYTQYRLNAFRDHKRVSREVLIKKVLGAVAQD